MDGKNSIVDALRRNGFNFMLDLLDEANLAANLSTKGPVTLFAMTDDAFIDLKTKSPMWYSALVNDQNLAKNVLSNHIVNDLVPRSNILPGANILTQGGPILVSSIDNGAV